jgi:hypothetical protein
MAPPEQRVGGIKRPSGIAALQLLPHLLQVKVISTISGRTWLMLVTVPRSVASLPTAGMAKEKLGSQRGAPCTASHGETW